MNLRRDRKRSLKLREMQEYSQALDTNERTDADERRQREAQAKKRYR